MLEEIANLSSRDIETSGATNSDSITTIGPHATIEGDLSVSGKVQIRGAVSGSVDADRVNVGTRGRVNGDIYAGAVIIEGTVKGEIQANHVRLCDSALVEGILDVNTLNAQMGAVISGECIIGEQFGISDAEAEGEEISKHRADSEMEEQPASENEVDESSARRRATEESKKHSPNGEQSGSSREGAEGPTGTPFW